MTNLDEIKAGAHEVDTREERILALRIVECLDYIVYLSKYAQDDDVKSTAAQLIQMINSPIEPSHDAQMVHV